MSSMGTRLILNGRVYSYGEREPQYSSEFLDHPLGYVNPPQSEYNDGPYKLRYRLMDRKNPENEWLTMPEMLELTRRSETWVATQVVQGAVDAAMVRGSGIPLFRIRDRTVILQGLLDAPAVRSPEAKRPLNKDRWDK